MQSASTGSPTCGTQVGARGDAGERDSRRPGRHGEDLAPVGLARALDPRGDRAAAGAGPGAASLQVTDSAAALTVGSTPTLASHVMTWRCSTHGSTSRSRRTATSPAEAGRWWSWTTSRRSPSGCSKSSTVDAVPMHQIRRSTRRKLPSRTGASAAGAGRTAPSAPGPARRPATNATSAPSRAMVSIAAPVGSADRGREARHGDLARIVLRSRPHRCPPR